MRARRVLNTMFERFAPLGLISAFQVRLQLWYHVVRIWQRITLRYPSVAFHALATYPPNPHYLTTFAECS